MCKNVDSSGLLKVSQYVRQALLHIVSAVGLDIIMFQGFHKIRNAFWSLFGIISAIADA